MVNLKRKSGMIAELYVATELAKRDFTSLFVIYDKAWTAEEFRKEFENER